MVSIFIEGVLDEVVLRHIIKNKTRMEVAVAVSGKGKPYLRDKARQLNRSAQGYPVIVLADLDNHEPCPADTGRSWMGNAEISQKFLLRFAVLSIEAWLLADRIGLSEFLQISTENIPKEVERINSPKVALVNLARKSRSRTVRAALVPSAKSKAVVGPNYNDELSRFVMSRWNVDAAARSSRSLSKTILRIQELAAQLET